MKMFVGFVILSLSTTAVFVSSISSIKFLHHSIMDLDGSYHILWTPTEDRIIIEVQVATRGWAGLGFSPSGGMGGADMVVGWIDKQGKVQLHDLYGVGNTKPRVDTSKDYTILGGYRNDTHTVLSFIRPWTTCDAKHDVQLSADTVRVIWAYNDILPNDLDTMAYHSKKRGAKSLYLKEPKVDDPLDEELEYWDVTTPRIEVPGHLDTLYWCSMFRIPRLRKKNHVIGFTPLYNPASNIKYVHHMDLYQCNFDNTEQVLNQYLNSKGVQCYSSSMPQSWNKCNTPIASFSFGSEGIFLPEHAGIPLGEEHGGANYFRLEIHYDNSFYVQGIVDKSGMRVYHTENLRMYDAGILTLGTTVEYRQMIPPGVEHWTSFGQCSSDCTRATFPAGGINVTNGLMHTHLLGRGITLKVIRDKKELPTRLRDDNYDFNYQEGRNLVPEMTLLPGDSLLSECYLDSSSRKKTTFGGFATTDEMCIIFLTYYPKIDFGVCMSVPSYKTLMKPLGIQGFYPMKTDTQKPWSQNYNITSNMAAIRGHIVGIINNDPIDATNIYLADELKDYVVSEPPALANKTWYDILNDKATWTKERLLTFQNAVQFGEHENHCMKPNFKHIEGVPKYVKYPNFYAYVPPAPDCQ